MGNTMQKDDLVINSAEISNNTNELFQSLSTVEIEHRLSDIDSMQFEDANSLTDSVTTTEYDSASEFESSSKQNSPKVTGFEFDLICESHTTTITTTATTTTNTNSNNLKGSNKLTNLNDSLSPFPNNLNQKIEDKPIIMDDITEQFKNFKIKDEEENLNREKSHLCIEKNSGELLYSECNKENVLKTEENNSVESEFPSFKGKCGMENLVKDAADNDEKIVDEEISNVGENGEKLKEQIFEENLCSEKLTKSLSNELNVEISDKNRVLNEIYRNSFEDGEINDHLTQFEDSKMGDTNTENGFGKDFLKNNDREINRDVIIDGLEMSNNENENLSNEDILKNLMNNNKETDNDNDNNCNNNNEERREYNEFTDVICDALNRASNMIKGKYESMDENRMEKLSTTCLKEFKENFSSTKEIKTLKMGDDDDKGNKTERFDDIEEDMMCNSTLIDENCMFSYDLDDESPMMMTFVKNEGNLSNMMNRTQILTDSLFDDFKNNEEDDKERTKEVDVDLNRTHAINQNVDDLKETKTLIKNELLMNNNKYEFSSNNTTQVIANDESSVFNSFNSTVVERENLNSTQVSNNHSTMEYSENTSEAGPVTAAEIAPIHNDPFLNDPSEFEHFLKIGGTGMIAENLRKQSLYVKFDPLVSSEVPLPDADNSKQSTPSRKSTSELPKESSTDGKSPAVGNLISVTPAKTPPTKKSTPQKTPRSRDMDPDDVAKLQSLLFKQMKKEESFQEEIDSIRVEYDELSEKLSNAENEIVKLKAELEATRENENKLKKELMDKIKNKQQLSLLMEEYERTISQMVTRREEERKEYEASLKKMEGEKESALQHLNNLEIAFNDIHQKYERGKIVNEALKKNEDSLKKSLSEYEQTVKAVEKKYEMLKTHATTQLEKANQELELITQSYEKEQAKLKAMLRKADIQINSLQNALDRKTKDNQELTTICDELIVKLSSHSNS